MKKYITVIVVLATTILACKKNAASDIEKNVVVKNLPTFESLYKLETATTSGKFMVSAYMPLGATDLSTSCEITISGVFLNKATQKPEIGQDNYFNNVKVECAPSNWGYGKQLNWDNGKELFGSQLNLKFKRGAPNSNNAVGGDTVLNLNGGYSPEAFICSNSFPESSMFSNGTYRSGTRLKPTYTFNWNKDTLNQNGVFIYLEYDPNDPNNASFVSANPERISNAIIVDDNGSYTLSSDLFTDLPLNSRLRIYIVGCLPTWACSACPTPANRPS